MKRNIITLFLALASVINLHAAITYELNGGVTNDYRFTPIEKVLEAAKMDKQKARQAKAVAPVDVAQKQALPVVNNKQGAAAQVAEPTDTVEGLQYDMTEGSVERTIVFDADVDQGNAGTDSNNATAYQITKSGVTMEVNRGILGTYNYEMHYRVFTEETLTLTSTVGKIVKVEFTCTANDDSKYGPGCLTVDGGDYTYAGPIGTWTGAADAIVFTATTDQVRATQVVVTIEGSTTPDTDVVNVTNLSFADAYYMEDDGTTYWDFQLYNVDESGESLLVPIVLLSVEAKSKTALNGTYDLLFALYGNILDEETNGVAGVYNDETIAATLTIKNVNEEGNYSFVGTFVGKDGKTYKINTVANVYAADDTTGEEIELKEEGNSDPVTPPAPPTDGTIVFDADVDQGNAGTDPYNATAYQITKSGVTMEVSRGILGTYNYEMHYRVFTEETLTLTSTVGKIVKVEFTCTANDDSKYGPGCLTVDGGDYTYAGPIGTWTGAANAIVFTATTNQVRANQVVVTIEGTEIPETPENPEDVITCTQAVEICEATGETPTTETYTIHGYVTEIKAAYVEAYDNISFWMADTPDGGQVLLAYRVKPVNTADINVAVGDYVEVVGTLVNYSGKNPEVNAGGIFTIITPTGITYELNGGVTNDYGWMSKGDMFTACITDALGYDLGMTLDEFKRSNTPFDDLFVFFNVDHCQNILDNARWDWLEEYLMMVQKEDQLAATLTAGVASQDWRYAIAAFFFESQYDTSLDYTDAGKDEAYIPYWKHGYDNPTQTTREFTLNAPYKENHIFEGWYATPDFSSAVVKTINASTSGTLYAKWKGPEYMVIEDNVTNLIIDLESMAIIGGPSTMYQVEVFLGIGEEDGNGKFVLTEESSVAIMGFDARLIDGYVYDIDVNAPAAKAVLYVEDSGFFYEFKLNMTSTPTEAIVVVVEDATVQIDTIPLFGDQVDYSLKMTANWTYAEDGVTYPVLVEVPVYYPEATEPYEIMSTVTVGGMGDDDPWLGFGEGTLTVTKFDESIMVQGIVNNSTTNFATNITISGKLPTLENPIPPCEDIYTTVEATACDSYDWNGQTYNQSGDYTYTTVAANGCDSIVTLHLMINQSVIAPTEYATICYGQTYTWNGQTYSTEGEYSIVLSNINGCDSIVTLHLTISQTLTTEETITACDSYDWNGQTYTQSGDYTYTTVAANGCDSIVTLHLTINQSEAAPIENATICYGETYTWNGQTYSTEGEYSITLSNIYGCDSIVTLHLTVLPEVIPSEESATICYGETYTWNGQTYATTGAYTTLLSSVFGCDSTAILHLTILPEAIRKTEYISAPTNKTVTWRGKEYNETGIYYDTVHFVVNPMCDSVIHMLDLTIADNIDSDKYCGDNLTWYYSNGALIITGSGDMYDNLDMLTYRDEPWYPARVTHVSLPDALTHISSVAFADCSNLTNIVIPNRVTSIGDGAFSWTGLQSVIIPASVTELGEQVFEACNNLHTIIYEGYPTVISNQALHPLIGCVHLDTVIAPAALWHCTNADKALENRYGVPHKARYIEVTDGDLTNQAVNYIAQNATALEVLDLTNTTNTTLPYGAFSHSYLLTQLYLPAYIEILPESMIEGGSRLSEITIPATVTEIGNYAFAGCVNIWRMTVEATTPPKVYENTFDGISRSISVLVPAGSEQAYREAEYWREFFIDNTNSPLPISNCQKILREDQILILREGKVYTTMGQLINTEE